MSRDNIVIAGTGGHAGVLIDLLRARDEYEIAGLIDRDTSHGEKSRYGIPIVGDDSALARIREEGICAAANGVGSAGDNTNRRVVFEKLAAAGFTLPVLVHPAAWCARESELGPAVQIMARAIVQGRAQLGRNVLVNSGAIVEHDCKIGDHVHVATGVRMGGDVIIGAGTFIGVGTSIKQGVRIGPDAVVGAGSVVISDVAAGSRVAGAPAAEITR